MKRQFYRESELKNFGIKFGKNCLIHVSVNITNPKNLILENDVRIDAFVNIISSKKIIIKSKVHIGPYVFLNSNGGEIILENFSGLSAGVQIYSHTDDYTGESFFGPFNLEKNSGKKSKIIIGKYSVIGSNSIILPGAKIPTGVSVGALTLVNTKLNAWSMYSGNPAKYILPRKKKLIKKIKLK